MKTSAIIRASAMVLFCSFLLNVVASCQERDRRENLQGYWRFTLGDNKKFAKPEYNDSEWEKIYVPSSWTEEGFKNYSGYAWYRKTFEFEMENNDDNLYLELGRIDDVDEVYFNGHRIGSTGGFPPEYYTAHSYSRRYQIPLEHINKKGKNVIAVRVFDEGGEGGIIGSTVGIYSYPNYSQNSVNLFGKWKFHLFDNPDWARENFDDSNWEDVLVPSSWETQGYRKYDGFAWYRKSFELPDNFKRDDLMLLLGKIDDMDEVFVNGTRIGGTGNINRKWGGDDEYNRYRNYSVPDDLLRSGNNVIAIRVYDQEQQGGIYEGPVILLPRKEYKSFWRKYRDENFDFHHWITYYLD